MSCNRLDVNKFDTLRILPRKQPKKNSNNQELSALLCIADNFTYPIRL